MTTCYICKAELNIKRKKDNDTKVCYECRSKKTLFITRTLAKKEFFLNDNDLLDVFSYHYVTNTHQKAQTITLYLKSELLAKARSKFKDFEKYKEEKIKKEKIGQMKFNGRKKLSKK